MKWKCFELSTDDRKARAHVVDNLSMGAHQHTLSRELLPKFEQGQGAFFLYAFDALDLESKHLYAYATYQDGKGWNIIARAQDISYSKSPIAGLVERVDAHLQSSEKAVVVCENWAATRENILRSPRLSRTLFYKEEVYHILTSQDAHNRESIDAAIRESMHHWGVGVCSFCGRLPHPHIQSAQFFREIVASTHELFVPALDGEGFIVWRADPAPSGEGGCVEGSGMEV